MKLKILLLTFLTIFLLSACTKNPLTPGDIDVIILNEEKLEKTLDIHLLIPYKISDLHDLNEIAYTSASLSYENYFHELKNEYYEFTLYFYTSEKSYKNKNSNLGYISFYINKDYENPGLLLKENKLKIK